MTAFLKVALVAVALGLDVFAVCVGVGISGKPANKRRIGLAFATAEVTMNLIGVGIGRGAGRIIGEYAAYIGFTALVGIGLYIVVESLKEEKGEFDLSSGAGLFLASLSISLDSLGIGFTLPYLDVPLVESLAAIFCVSLLSTASGLTLGRKIGARMGGMAGIAAGIILVLTGLGFGIEHYLRG